MELGILPYLRAIWSTGVITVDKDKLRIRNKEPGHGQIKQNEQKKGLG